jgi:hypothetical protein
MHNCLATRQARALAVQQKVAPPQLTGQAQPAAAAMAGLKARIERLAAAGLLGGRTIEAATAGSTPFAKDWQPWSSAASSTTATRHRSGVTTSEPLSLVS